MIPQYMEFKIVWMDQHIETADYSGMVWIGILYIPDETVLDGSAERF